jgi:hypothetical protein
MCALNAVTGGRWREHEDGEGMSLGKKDGGAAHQWGSGVDEVADGAARWRFFECGNARVSLGDNSGVLQHGGVEGGEGGRLIEEEEGRRVGSPEEGGTTGVVGLRPNSGEGRGSRCLSTHRMGSWCKGGGGLLGRSKFGKWGAAATGHPL